MSQVKKIYQFLFQCRDGSADKALALALRRAEPAYAMAILKTILYRGNADASAEIIAHCHNYEPQWKDLLIRHYDKLERGLRLAADSPDPQVRSNVLSLMHRARQTHHADIAVKLVRDRHAPVARQAGTTLIHLANTVLTTQGRQTLQDVPTLQLAQASETLEQRREFLVNALAMGLRDYKEHKNLDVILAAMMVTEPSEPFWRDFLSPSHAVTRAIKDLLLNHERPELARFYLGALKESHLRVTAIRGLSHQHRAAFLTALARSLAEHENEALCAALKLIRQPVWLNHRLWPTASLNEHDRYAVIEFVGHLGADPSRVADFLLPMLEQASESMALTILDKLTHLPVPINATAVAQVCKHRQGSVALKATQALITLKPGDLTKTLIGLLSSPHEAVRELAAEHCQLFAFGSYWRNFDHLSVKQRQKAGQAVFKVDPTAHEKWRHYFSSKDAGQRLRAIRMAQALDKTQEVKQELLLLCHDTDQMVRSCAIGALGKNTATPQSSGFLRTALHDKDPRVQANAIEAIERQGLHEFQREVEPLMRSDHNRIRANAIKAMLNWKVASAQQAIQAMVSDSRSAHRRSAQWLVNQLHPGSRQSLAVLNEPDALAAIPQ